jgi:inner membrane protein
LAEILKLHYAKAEDLGQYLNLTAVRDVVVVQFWLRPRDVMVELSFSGDTGKTSTPRVLEEIF